MTTTANTMTTAAHRELAQAVICELKRIKDPATASPIWPRLLEFIQTDPRPFARALGLVHATDHTRRRGARGRGQGMTPARR